MQDEGYRYQHCAAAGWVVCRVGQNHIHTVYIRQGNHLIFGHTRCRYIYGSGQP